MEVLKLNQYILKLMYIHRNFENESILIKFGKFLFSATILICQLFALVSSTIFLFKYFESDIEGSLYAVFETFGTTSSFYTVTAAFIMRSKINKLIDKLQSIYDYR